MGDFSGRETLHIARSLGLRCIVARLLYALRQRIDEARRQPGLGAWTLLTGSSGKHGDRGLGEPVAKALGDLLSHRVEGQVVDLTCSNGVLRLEILSEDLIRVRMRQPGMSSFPPVFSYAVDPEVVWSPVTFDMKEDASSLAFRTSRLICRIQRAPCRIAFLDSDGNPLSEASSGLGFLGEGVFCTRKLVEAEPLYGLGEKAFDLNLRGRALEMWNTDPAVYSPGDDPINLNIPFLVGLRQGRAYGFFFDNPGRAHFNLGQAHHDEMRYEADSGELCLYFVGGPSPTEVLRNYTRLTGRMSLPPRWMLGYHQSRWSYYPESQVRDTASELRQRKIPCDVLHLDIHYLDGYRVFTWDAERFPNPPGLLAELRDQGFRAISIIDPGVKVDPGYGVHDEGKSHDLFCKLSDGSLFQGPVWPGPCHFPDFTEPRVREWWGGLYRPLLEAGLAGFWNDMNEPAIFGGEMARHVRHSYEGMGADHDAIHNVYGLQMARASAEGLRQLRPKERVPLISRSGYAGLQRYALVWTGDNQSTWAQLRLGVSMCLNLGMSGVAFCGPDVGGFSGDCDGELLARWTQVGALTPFFRNHSALGTARQEPWAFGQDCEAICRRWIELRYQLLPYIYTTAWQAARSGLPMMRPLALTFPEDRRTYNIDDQFLLGDALLAAPVGRPGQTRRQVYLPGGLWYDYWTGEQQSGSISADAPLERMPIFVRAGSVVPMGPVIQHTGQWPPQALQLHVYPGDGESWLYEDDGHSMAHAAGESFRTRFVSESTAGGLVVHREAEGPFDPAYDRYQITIHGLSTAPRKVLVDNRSLVTAFDADEKTASLTIGPWQRLEIA